MSKRTSPPAPPKRTDKSHLSQRHRFITPKAKMLMACAVACLLLVTGTLAQLGLLRRTTSNSATTAATPSSTATVPRLATLSSSAAATTTTASFAPNAPSKEYIYAGGRLLATEEPGGDTPSFTTGFYEIVARHSGKCLDIDGGNPNRVQQWQCLGGTNQQWRFAPTSGGYYQLFSRWTNEVLEVFGGMTNNGDPIASWYNSVAANQQWQVISTGDGYYKLLARHSNKAIDVADGSQADGVAAHQWAYVGGANQQWLLRRVSPYAVPGIIQAEDFDSGTDGATYHDLDAGNNNGVQYRTSNVDIGRDGAGAYLVNYTQAGEWLSYKIDVATTGTYTFEVRAGAPSSGATMHVEIDGVNVSGAISLQNTGAFYQYQTTSKAGISLTVGQHTMRVAFDTNNQTTPFLADFDYFRFTLSNQPPQPPTIGGRAVSVATGTDNLPRVLWRLNNGAAQIWAMSADGTSKTASVTYGPIAGWTPTALTVGANNSPYLLWRNTDGRVGIWRLNADNTYNSHSDYGPISADWTPLTIAAGGDSLPRVMWRNTNGQISIWTVQANWSVTGIEHGPYAGWQAVSLGIGYDSRPRIVWRYTDGRLSLWTCNPDGSYLTGQDYGPYAGWGVDGVTVGADNLARVTWKHTDGRISLWNVDGAGTFLPPAYDHGPIGGWEVRAMGTGGDSLLRLLWQQTTGGTGEVSFWTLNANNTVSSSTNYSSP